jgi:hypothetical protein
MRLFRRNLVLIVVATAIGCSDNTGPTTIPGVFILRTVDGETVPGISPAPLDPAFRTLSGTVTLHADGTAILFEHRIDFTQTPAAQEAITRVLSYSLDGHRIIINPDDCPPNATCMAIRGILLNSTLSLNSPFGGDFTYVYHRADDSDLLRPHEL